MERIRRILVDAIRSAGRAFRPADRRYGHGNRVLEKAVDAKNTSEFGGAVETRKTLVIAGDKSPARKNARGPRSIDGKVPPMPEALAARLTGHPELRVAMESYESACADLAISGMGAIG